MSDPDPNEKFRELFERATEGIDFEAIIKAETQERWNALKQVADGAARANKIFYDSLVGAGFDRREAMQITLNANKVLGEAATNVFNHLYDTRND